jgi:hypothetical protein
LIEMPPPPLGPGHPGGSQAVLCGDAITVHVVFEVFVVFASVKSQPPVAQPPTWTS